MEEGREENGKFLLTVYGKITLIWSSDESAEERR